MAKRIASSSVNWTLIAEKIQEDKKAVFLAFKGKSDKYLRKITANPAELPKIDFSQYKTKIPVPGMVDTFQKSYEGLKIPYPSDKGFLAKVDQEEVASLKKVAEMDEMLLKQLAELKSKLTYLESVIPFSEMSLEELAIARPEYRIDPDKPKLWPQFIDKDYPDNPPRPVDDHH